mmetsp:Transcript_7013/g.10893  ORF Transcript_7013/g.10893 Transcript_7013/m.10893 type:complete len:519 (+) Transcript_7013:419-1975(+)
MKFIAGRRNIQTIANGAVSIDGERKSPQWRSKHISFMEQDSALQPTATVRESLTFAALFKSKSSTTKSEIKEKVNLVMQSLKLSDKASCIIGGEGVDRFCRIEGLSGGERQRVAFAEHLLDDLSDIFILDEPTSSLDSNAAQLVVTLAKQLCHSGKIVLLSIHQPSYRLFGEIDNIILLSHGKIVHTGGHHVTEEFFRGFGYGIPPNMCPAERYLELIQDISVTKNLAACAARNRVKGNRALSSTIGDTCNNDQTDQELSRGESMKEKKQRRNITHIEKMKASPSYYSSSAQKPLTGVFVIDYNEYDNGDLCSHGSDEGDEGKDYDSYDDDDDDVSNHDVDDDFRRGRTYSCRYSRYPPIIKMEEESKIDCSGNRSTRKINRTDRRIYNESNAYHYCNECKRQGIIRQNIVITEAADGDSYDDYESIENQGKEGRLQRRQCCHYFPAFSERKIKERDMLGLSLSSQFRYLMQRKLKDYLRNRLCLQAQVLNYVGASIIIGSFYHTLRTKLDVVINPKV